MNNINESKLKEYLTKNEALAMANAIQDGLKKANNIREYYKLIENKLPSIDIFEKDIEDEFFKDENIDALQEKIEEYFNDKNIYLSIVHYKCLLEGIRYDLKLREGTLIAVIKDSLEDLKQFLNIKKIDLKLDTKNQLVNLIIYNDRRTKVNFRYIFFLRDLYDLQDNKNIRLILGKDMNGVGEIIKLESLSNLHVYSSNVKKIDNLFDNLINSILLTCEPSKLKMMLASYNNYFDKYNGIPHLSKIVFNLENDVDNSKDFVNELIHEYELRQKLMLDKKTLYYKDYNKKILSEGEEDNVLNPFVVFIDNLDKNFINVFNENNKLKEIFKSGNLYGIYLIIGILEENVYEIPIELKLNKYKEEIVFRLNHKDNYSRILFQDVDEDIALDEVYYKNSSEEINKVRIPRLNEYEINDVISFYNNVNLRNETKYEMLNRLLKETNMNESTITEVYELIKSNVEIDKVIRYIKRYKEFITDHQLRQFIADLIMNKR